MLHLIKNHKYKKYTFVQVHQTTVNEKRDLSIAIVDHWVWHSHILTNVIITEAHYVLHDMSLACIERNRCPCQVYTKGRGRYSLEVCDDWRHCMEKKEEEEEFREIPD